MVMKVALGLAAVVGATEQTERKFLAYVAKYEKTYTATEFAVRYNIFRNNMKTIEEHNQKGESWTMGVNQFTDMTGDEFGRKVVGGCFTPNETHGEGTNVFTGENMSAADSVDWVSQGKVTAVKNQGQCGSCWAFSTTGAIESRSAIASNGSPNELSEQQLVDCAGKYGNLGCNGGLMDSAFQYVISEGGLCSESAYPYTAQSSFRPNCQDSCSLIDPISSYTDVRSDNMSSLQTAVSTGPVSIAIEADQSAFQMYNGGVMTGRCGNNIDHGVLAVGYGTDSGQDYWKVKNSWGAEWGEAGYIRMGKGMNVNSGSGQCGILSQPSFPVV